MDHVGNTQFQWEECNSSLHILFPTLMLVSEGVFLQKRNEQDLEVDQRSILSITIIHSVQQDLLLFISTVEFTQCIVDNNTISIKCLLSSTDNSNVTILSSSFFSLQFSEKVRKASFSSFCFSESKQLNFALSQFSLHRLSQRNRQRISIPLSEMD